MRQLYPKTEQPSQAEAVDSRSLLMPGNVFILRSVGELTDFEDLVAASIDPHMSTQETVAWESRKHIRDYVRPSKFNGNITNITVELMEDPYERLIDAPSRGWVLPTAKYERPSQKGQDSTAKYIGLMLTADARSSGKGVIGQIQSEIWYAPVPLTTRRRGNGEFKPATQANAGMTVMRVAAQPKLERENFIEFDRAARRVGHEVLRQQIRNPIMQPFRN